MKSKKKTKYVLLSTCVVVGGQPILPTVDLNRRGQNMMKPTPGGKKKKNMAEKAEYSCLDGGKNNP